MTEGAGQSRDAPKAIDDDLSRRHDDDLRYERNHVNVDNVCEPTLYRAMPDATEIGLHLKALRERAGLSMAELAKKLGYKGASSVQTLERPDRGDKPIALPTVRRMAPHFFGKGAPAITAPEIALLLGGKTMAFETPQEQAAVYDLLGLPLPEGVKDRVSVIPVPVSLMPVVGSVQASFWMTSSPSIDAPVEHLAIPFMPDIPVAEQYALKVVGPSMNRLVLEGAYVICARYGGSHRRAQHGKVVHVERERYGETEWTLKRIRYDRDGTGYLWPESTHPDFQDPVPLLDGDNEGSIRILGVAIGYFAKLD